MTLRSRIRVYAPNGALTGSLPSPIGISLAVPLNDMPSLQLEYHPDSPGSVLLDSPSEVAVEFLNPSSGDYEEFPGCRFLNIRHAGDRLDRAGVFRYNMPSYGWQLRKVRNINFAAFDENGGRGFTAATVGEIIATLINEAKSRGNVPGLVIDFDGTEDSDGQAWADSLTINIDAGQDIWSVLDAFTRQGLCDWRMNQRTLQIYNADTFLDRDLTTDPAVILRSNFDHTAEPNDATYEDLASKALVQGENNTFLEVDNPTALTPWGEWEEFISQAGVEDTGTMTILAQKVLEGKRLQKVQMTRQMIFREGSPLPFIDYRPGDHILSTDNEGNQNTDLRVQQLTVSSQDQGDLEAFITLNDRFTERDIRNQRFINSLTGLGGPSGSGGSGGNATPPTEDTRSPAQVTGLVVMSSTYIDDNGNPVGQATATWSQVTTSTGGSAMDIDRYEVQARLQGLPAGFESKTFVTDPQTTAFVSPLDVGGTYDFRVRAVGANGRTGPFSATVSVLIAADATPTDAPSTPILSSRLGTIRATWDGLDENALPMPVDFSHIQVEMADNGTGPWEEVGRIFTGGDSVIVTDQPYMAERFFRFLSVDTSGNISDPSAVASIFVVRVEGPDIEANSITTNHIVAGSITAEKIQAYAITADRLAIGQARNLITDHGFRDADLSAWRVSTATAPPNSGNTITWAWTGTTISAQLNNTGFPDSFGRLPLVNNLLLDTDVAGGATLPSINLASPVDGDLGNIIGRFQVNISVTSGSWTPGATVDIEGFTRFYDGDGNNISPVLNVATQTYSAATGGFVTHQSVSGSAVPSNAVVAIPYLRVVFHDHTDTNVLVEFASPFWSQNNSEVLIENGAISANKIQANAVTTTQLDAVAITAKHTITGSFIQTATSGVRVTMGPNANFLNQAGIRLWSNADPNHTANVFVADLAGAGGWDPQSFAIVGPETVRNSTGRADINLRINSGWYIRKKFVNTNNELSAVSAGDTSNELQLNGTMPRGVDLGDSVTVFRVFSAGFGNGSITWGTDNGWVYRPVFGPRNTSDPGSPRYTSSYAVSSSGFSWRTSAAISRVEVFCWRGTFNVDL